MMENFLNDVRCGFRLLFKKPVFTIIVVMVLALCVGANTAIFSLVNAILLRPLDYQNPDRLVRVWAADTAHGFPESELSPPDIYDIRNQSQTLETLSAFYAKRATLTGVGEPLRLKSVLVSPSFFTALGVQPALGRFFVAEEEQEGKNHVVVLGHKFWQERFNSNPKVLGEPLVLDDVTYTVVGVLPPKFEYIVAGLGSEPQLWQPLTLDLDPNARASRLLDGIARLKSGVSLPQAQSEMSNIARRLEEQYPDSNKGYGVTLEPLQESLVGDTRPALLLMLVAVLFVLLIACANVANLLLARATWRRKEFNVRAALGGTRRRLIQQLLIENLILGVLGGAIGLILSWFGLALLVAISPTEVPRLDEVHLDWRVLGFSLFITLLTSVIVSLAPALLVSKTDLSGVMKEGGRSSSGNHTRFQKTLVVSEVALALMLLVGSGLMVKSFYHILQINPGFGIENVLTMKIFVPPTRYPKTEQVSSFYNELFERLKALPNVQAVGAADILPLSGDQVCQDFTIDNRPPSGGADPCVETRVISPAYFGAMGIPLQSGAQYTGQEDVKSRPVAIINQAMAQHFWPNEDPLGKRLTIYGVSREIIGVVANVKHFGLDAEAAPELYLPLQQKPRREMSVVVRTGSNPTGIENAVRANIWAIDRDLPVYGVKTMAESLASSLAQRRFTMMLLIIFAVMAMILTAVGIYGVISYSVSLRTNEIGVRAALGAQQSDILKLIVKQGAVLCGIGLGLGLIATLILTRLMSRLLFGVDASDPLTYVTITLALAGVGILASYFPARRAAKIDPIIALRE